MLPPRTDTSEWGRNLLDRSDNEEIHMKRGGGKSVVQILDKPHNYGLLVVL